MMPKRSALLFNVAPFRAVLSLIFATGVPFTAQASSLPFPPLAFEDFNPSSTLIGEVSTMTISFSNSNVSAIDGVSFIDTYPFGILNAPGNPVLANTCGGTLAAGTPGNDGFSLSLSGASIDTQGCYLQIAVVGTASGSFQNETGTISSTSAPPGASAIASLAVSTGAVLSAPIVSNSFAPASVPPGGVSQMTIKLTNTDPSRAVINAHFSDVYPAGMQETAFGVVESNTCGGDVMPFGTSLELDNGMIPAGRSCSVVANLIGTSTSTNSTGPVTSDNAQTGTAASATLTVAQGALLDAPGVSMSFTPDQVVAGDIVGTSLMAITLTNGNPYDVTGVKFTDNYPTPLHMANAPSGVILANTCGQIGTLTADANATSMALVNGTIPASDSCIIKIQVLGTSAGVSENHTGLVTSDNAYPGADASAILTVTGGAAAPDLALAKTHAGNFTQGQTGATYTIIATNQGGAPSAGLVTVSDALPAGLAASGMSGSGWVCDIQTTSCTYGDPIAPGTSAPAITLTVDVAANAPSSVTNTATVAGGGESDTSNDTASDPTAIDAASDSPDLTLTKSHLNNFSRGQSGAIFLLSAHNVGATASNGVVHVTDALPGALIATNMGGAGWTCDVHTTSCWRSDPLARGATYPDIMLVVNVAANAPSTVLNTALVSGGGEDNVANDGAADVANIVDGSSANPQTIVFESLPPANAIVAGASYAASASASSHLPVVLTIDPSAAKVCTIDGGGAVSFIGAGTCTIDANQGGDATWAPAPQVQQSFAVAGAGGTAQQSIAFTSIAPGNAMVGGPSYQPTAGADPSHLPVALTIDASSALVCAIDGSGIVSFIGAGTCTIDADQGGDATYAPAPEVRQSFAVTSAGGAKAQSILFTSMAPTNAEVGGPAYKVTAMADSGLPVLLTIDAASATICTISNGMVNFIGAGPCTIDATQGGDANYAPAAEVQQSFDVAPAAGETPQQISFMSTAPATATVGGPSYLVVATADSDLPVVLTIDTSSATVCTIDDGTVSFIGAGACTIDANQGGDATFAPAPQMQQSFAVVSANGTTMQTIVFASTPPNPAIVAGTTYLAVATADSHLPVVLTIDASSATVCTIDHDNVAFIGVGTCVIDANQGGDTTYASAAQVQQSFAVVSAGGAMSQTIAFASIAPADATVGGPSYLALATASSHLPVVLTIDAAAAGVCTINHGTVSFVGAGTCTIDANQGGDGTYAAAPEEQQAFVVTVASAPTVSCTLSAQTGMVGDAVSIDLSQLFAPPANDTLEYGATDLPPSLSITGPLLTGTLQASDLPLSPYVSTLKATAALGGGTASEDVMFIVLPLGEILLRDGFDGPVSAPSCH